MDTKTWVLSRHEYWWKFLLKHMPFALLDDTAPVCEFVVKNSKSAGTASRRDCRYNLAYAVTGGRTEYDWTICHEICHTFAARAMHTSATHGELWAFLYNKVCGASRGRFHSYNRAAAAQAARPLRKILKLQEKIRKLTEE